MPRHNLVSWMDYKVRQAAHGCSTTNDAPAFQYYAWDRTLRRRKTARSLSTEATHFITGDKTKRGALLPRLLKASAALRDER